MLDDDLLSHGETPHYHRRSVVSLLSAGWDQVVPTLYGRQAIRLGYRGLGATPNQVCDVCWLRFNSNFRFSVDFTITQSAGRFFGLYMFKPHGHILLSISTPHIAFQPRNTYPSSPPASQ